MIQEAIFNFSTGIKMNERNHQSYCQAQNVFFFAVNERLNTQLLQSMLKTFQIVSLLLHSSIQQDFSSDPLLKIKLVKCCELDLRASLTIFFEHRLLNTAGFIHLLN